MRPLITDLTKEQLAQSMQPAFRAKQIFGWLYTKYVDTFEAMNNLPKNLIKELNENYILSPLRIVKKEQSVDGSLKYLFELYDSHTIEAVLLPMKQEKRDEQGRVTQEAKYTICVSSQVGCKVGCAFCLTAKGGFVRNLSPGEIVYQVVAIKKENNIPSNKRVNIVYMGMGEPLDNLENVSKAIDIFKDQDGLAIAPRRQTISTSGISSKIDKLGDLDKGVLLAISLHAVDDATREALIPMNKAYNIQSIIDAVHRFPIDQRKRVMFEYLMIKDLNLGPHRAKKLAKLLKGIKSKVNLIYFNPYPGSPFLRPTEQEAEAFQNELMRHGLLCTIRESKGIDISAACGQLKEKCND
jgi:23S rRNA (adenine2503-C2)-methyltransferase